MRKFYPYTKERANSVYLPSAVSWPSISRVLPEKDVAYTVATTGNLDSDGELCLLFQELGAVKFEFTGPNDIMEISEMISAHIM